MKKDEISQPANPAKRAKKTELDINSLPFLCYQFTPKDKAEKLAQLKADYPKFTERLIKKYIDNAPKMPQ